MSLKDVCGFKPKSQAPSVETHAEGHLRHLKKFVFSSLAQILVKPLIR